MIELFILEKTFKIIESNHHLHNSPWNLDLLWDCPSWGSWKKQLGQFPLTCMLCNGEGQKTLKNYKTNRKLYLNLYVCELSLLYTSPSTALALCYGLSLRALELLEATAVPKAQPVRSKRPLKIRQDKERLKLNDCSLLDPGQQEADSALPENIIKAIGPVIDWRIHSTVGGKDRSTRKGKRDKTINKLVIAGCTHA